MSSRVPAWVGGAGARHCRGSVRGTWTLKCPLCGTVCPPVPPLCLGVPLSLFLFNVPLSPCVPQCPPVLVPSLCLTDPPPYSVPPHLVASLPPRSPPASLSPLLPLCLVVPPVLSPVEAAVLRVAFIVPRWLHTGRGGVGGGVAEPPPAEPAPRGRGEAGAVRPCARQGSCGASGRRPAATGSCRGR